METTRTFPRTLAEAFPNDSAHRVQYACAIEISVKQSLYWVDILVYSGVFAAIVYLFCIMY